MSHVFGFMGTDGKGGFFRAEPGRGLEGYTGIIGSVLISAVLAGLAFIGVVIRLSGNLCLVIGTCNWEPTRDMGSIRRYGR